MVGRKAGYSLFQMLEINFIKTAFLHLNYVFYKEIFIFFLVFPESGLRSKRQHNGSNRLDIKPTGPHHKPVGKNLFFTCKAEVSNPSLVRDLKWLKPSGQNIPEDDRLEISKFRNFLNRFDLRKGNIYLVSKINSL